MSRPHVVVVGGGLSGLAAGLACADAGARVTLLEERTRLGGATWSTLHQGLWIDNGQHVFLRCCQAYRAFLERLGVADLARLQARLDVPVVSPGGRTAALRRSDLPAPLHLLTSVLRYRHVSIADRLRIARSARSLARIDAADPQLDEQSLGEWLERSGQSPRTIERFWDLFVRATLNVPARDASLALATMVFQTGLLTDSSAGDIGVAQVPLQHLHGDPAGQALEKAGARVQLRTPVDAVECAPQGFPAVLAGGRRVECDAVILAVPHAPAARILPPEAAVDRAALAGLGASPIVNLHVVYDRPVTRHRFAAAVGSPVQWIFDRSAAAGLERGQYLALSLSAADAYVGVSSADLRRTFEPALAQLFPAAREASVERFFATCERTATFRQVPGTQRLRAGTQTRLARVFLAGAWTDTGWPDTMEGAVRSGNAAAQAALRATGREGGMSARAA